MSSVNEVERRRLQDAYSTPVGYSMSQREIKRQREADKRVLGKTISQLRSEDSRARAREERRQALHDGINRIFNGSATEQDVVSVVVFSPEFEKDCDVVNASVLDLIGRPGFFGREKKTRILSERPMPKTGLRGSLSEEVNSRINGSTGSEEVGSLTPEQRNVQDILQDAVADQLALIASGRFNAFRGVSDDRFFETFMQDQLFMEVYALAQREIQRFTDDWDFTRYLRGALFERMGFAYLSAHADGSIPVSGRNAFDISHALEPDVPVQIHPFDHPTLIGRYIPDGLMVTNVDGYLVVNGIIEYSSGLKSHKKNNDSKSDNDLVSQYHGYQKLVEKLGKLAYNPSFVLVSPTFRESNVLQYGGKQVLINEVSLPFSANRFTENFEQFIYFKYREGDGSPTLADLRKQWHESPAGQQPATGEPIEAFWKKK